MTVSHPGSGQIFLGSALGDIDFHRRPSNFFVSFLFHAAVIILIWLLGRSMTPVLHGGRDARAWQAEFPIVFSGTGGGSGGSQDLLPPSTGALPRLTPDEQFAPPSAVVMNENPGASDDANAAYGCGCCASPDRAVGRSAVWSKRAVVEWSGYGRWNRQRVLRRRRTRQRPRIW